MAMALSASTMAQQAATEEPQIEKIEVTGSRLKGVDMEGANPLQVFSRDELTSRGYDSISSFLRDLPQASAGTFNEIGSTAGNDGTPAGSAGVSLRGLGSSSTLVLVNGRRVAVDSFANGADTFVNVNAIPMSAIERVEIRTDGASSVYGSDAIAALRYDSYSDFGSDVNPKLSLRYRATDNLILRASASTGFRAPSLSQIGAGKSLGFNYISCLPGQPFLSFCGNQPVEIGYDEERVGNKELDAEKSRALNVGMSWNLTDSLQLTVDYWRYRHTDIVDYDSITTLRGCLSGDVPVTGSEAALGDSFGCVVVNNELVFLRTGFYNIGSQETDGIDVNLNYRLDTDYGSFKFYATGTKTFNYERQLTPDSPKEDLLGRLSGANEIARPDLVADFGTDWRSGNWKASLSAHYVSSMGDGDFRFGGNETVKSWTTLSGSLGYDITDNQSISLAVRNLTDKAPPYASSPTNGYASSVHDWIGRLWTLRYTVSF